MDLPKKGIDIAAWQVTPTRIELGFESEVFHHAVAFELPGLPHAASDNFFDLYPGRRRRVAVDFDRPISRYEVLRKLQWRSLATSYE
jgi:beta-mannosidase